MNTKKMSLRFCFDMKNYYTFNSKIGKLTLVEEENALTNLFLGEPKSKEIKPGVPGKLMNRAFEQITEYLNGERKSFDLPLNPAGTEFQKRVWNELKKIPYAQVVTYGEIAKLIGNKNACRAVGGANNKNPLPILIPCHRVVGKKGDLTGYALGLDLKKYLLEIESSNK